jgi:hypothetical protein
MRWCVGNIVWRRDPTTVRSFDGDVLWRWDPMTVRSFDDEILLERKWQSVFSVTSFKPLYELHHKKNCILDCRPSHTSLNVRMSAITLANNIMCESSETIPLFVMKERWLIPLITLYVSFLFPEVEASTVLQLPLPISSARLGKEPYVCNGAWTPNLRHISHSLHLEKEPFSMLDPQLSRFTCSSSETGDFLALSDLRASNVPHSLQSLQDLSGLKKDQPWRWR